MGVEGKVEGEEEDEARGLMEARSRRNQGRVFQQE